ncbi:SAUR-like auxin-responsive protein family [Perilla frutescens var. hirtella]|uniref:SAUR-like auxin-responsive protein family n=1 Tax=Perilla frutescens var. hirtella TaxID=608512 RepID=A0AAD4NYZ6_PERFH|nr:SAUR-like auxin-responsive protein family [Perilla frutescens var. hirtella]
MGSCFLTRVCQTKHIDRQHSNTSCSSPSSAEGKLDTPRGFLAVYVGESKDKTRFFVPISYLKHPLFQDLLRFSEEEYGFDHPMGGLTIPCSQEAFLNVTSRLHHLRFQWQN